MSGDARADARPKTLAAIARWRANLLALERLVEERQVTLDRAFDEFRGASRKRDRAAARLSRLVDQVIVPAPSSAPPRRH